MDKNKPLGSKSYGSIPHLPGSRTGERDRTCSDGQYRICCEKKRDKKDIIIVQEKLDGGNVVIANINGEIIALTRSGYTAITSPYKHHHIFNDWVKENEDRFKKIIPDGYRACGEWLYQSCGTIYKLWHEPFVLFDIITGTQREPFDVVQKAAKESEFITPYTLHVGESISIDDAIELLGDRGHHGAQERAEGIVYRVERYKEEIGGMCVDFLAKYVRRDKVDGKYMIGKSDDELITNDFISSSEVLRKAKSIK